MFIIESNLPDTNQLISTVPGSQEEAVRQGREPTLSGVYHIQRVPDDGSRWISEGPLFLAARKSYIEPVLRHSLGRMNIECPSCGALHWMAEKKSSSSKSSPRFSTCCSDGRVSLPLLQPPPEPLQSMLTSMDRPAVKFREDIWKYNRALSFTSLGVHEGCFRRDDVLEKRALELELELELKPLFKLLYINGHEHGSLKVPKAKATDPANNQA
jgi:hypothetical protein